MSVVQFASNLFNETLASTLTEDWTRKVNTQRRRSMHRRKRQAGKTIGNA